MNEKLLIVKNLAPHVVQITLNRPEKRNALSSALMEALLEAIQQTSGARVLILDGAGPFFCAGLDLEEGLSSSELIARLLYILATLPCVTIASVHGGAYAGGLGLASACDLVLASREALFALPELRRGLLPALVYQLLQDQVQRRFLHELILTGEAITAVRAHTIGLVNQVIAFEEREEMVHVYVQQVLKAAPHAVQLYKKRLYQKPDLETAFQHALALHQEARSSSEAAEGLQAFREKRSPSWVK